MQKVVFRVWAQRRAALRTAVSGLALIGAAAFAALPSAPADGTPDAPAAARAPGWVHAYAAFGEPKYPRGADRAV